MLVTADWSIHERVVGSLGDDFVEGGKGAEKLRPEGAVVLVAEEAFVGREDEPSGVFDFFF